jgi:hypothetical protein
MMLRLLAQQSRNVFRRMTLGMMAIALLSLAACSNPATKTGTSPTTSTTAKSNDAASALKKISNRSARIYSLSKTANWDKADAQLKELKKAADKLKQTSSGNGNADMTALQTQVSTLEQAVNSKNSQASMQAANETILKSIDLSKQTHSSEPVDALLLGYYGRQLELAATQQNAEASRNAAANIQKTWSGLRSQVQAQADAEQTKQIDTLVGQLGQAKSTQEYARIAPQLVKAERNLEKSLS